MALIEDRFEDTLCISRGDPPRVLEVRQGDRWVLPVVRTRDHHPADVRSTRRAVAEQLGVDVFVLECREVTVRDGVAHRVLDAEALNALPVGARMGQRWRASRAPQSHVVGGRGWTGRGWFARTKTWLVRQARAGGWAIRSVEQIRVWEFSCVLQVETDRGELYFKALPRVYGGEVALLQQLATWHPSSVPAVVAADLRRRWLLVRACAGRCLEDGASLAAWRRVARAYGELQVASAVRADRLRVLGCRDRSPGTLRAALGPLLSQESALLVGEEHGLTPAEFQRLRAWQPRLEAACDDLTASGLPPALEHGDLWASNIFVGSGAPTFIDWTDASLSHPFLSLGPLLRSASWDPHLAEHPDWRRRIADAYLDAWSSYAKPVRLRRMLALAEPLAALHIAVSYWRLTPQPHHQWWMPRGVPFFARMALESLP